MKNIFVVASPGRTGSNLILEMLTGDWPNGVDYASPGSGILNALPIWLPWNFSDQSPTAWKRPEQLINFANQQQVVIHTHQISLINALDPKQIILIMSLRRDLFAQVMSLVISNITQEWNGKEYSKKQIIPQKFDPAQFLRILEHQKEWINDINTELYQKVVTIYYEDLVAQKSEFLAQQLGIPYVEDQVIKVNEKSPYCYKDIVLNWTELHEVYLKTCNGV
jgi:hypothetical protein